MYPHLIKIAWLALMHCSTKLPIVQLARVRLYALVVLSILVLALMGDMPDGEAGWIICPPQVVVGPASRRCRLRGHLGRDRVSGGGDRWLHPLHTWHIPLMRSLLLWASWHLRGQVGPLGSGWFHGFCGCGRVAGISGPGCGVSQVPMASLCTGLSVIWPLEVAQNLVPNS